MGLPEGRVISQHEGGREVLQKTIGRIRRYRFIGYLRTYLAMDGGRSEGIVAFEMGQPVLSVYVHEWDEKPRGGRVYMGRKAVEFMWEDSVFPSARISLHADVPLDEIQGIFPQSEVTNTDIVSPPFLPGPPSPIITSEEGEVPSFIRVWGEKGYDLSDLERLLAKDRDEALMALPYLEANLLKLESIRDRLLLMDTRGVEREAESIRRKTVDPERVGEVEAELDRFERRLTGDDGDGGRSQIDRERERKVVDEKMDAVYDLILQYHRMRSSGDHHMTCPDCGSYLTPEGDCPLCLIATHDEAGRGRRLNPRFTFDTFVVGSNSRFAEAASRAVARNPGAAYNPLFLYSPSGLGKTHLLQAIGNRIRSDSPGMRVIYTSMEVFESELIDALSQGHLDPFRESYQELDVLLMDDLQFIAGREETQEELFRLFNILVEGGKQVVMACDRLPKDIPSLSERLMTRFESGLIADIQPPILETRLAILERMAREKCVEVSRKVLSFIAEVRTSNVREMEGGLNRIIAYSSLMNTPLDLATARKILLYDRPDQPGVDSTLEEGSSYLVEERRPFAAHRLASAGMGRGSKVLAITRGHPRYLRETLGEGDGEIFWLTDGESSGEDTVGHSLERIMLVLEEFLEQEGSKLMLLDDIQYLISNNSFEGVIRFLRSVVDRVHEEPAIFLVSMNPQSLDPQRRSIVEREMIVLTGNDP
jgi:chromosomal replication initiator protein DnaA